MQSTFSAQAHGTVVDIGSGFLVASFSAQGIGVVYFVEKAAFVQASIITPTVYGSLVTPTVNGSFKTPTVYGLTSVPSVAGTVNYETLFGSILVEPVS